MKRFTVVIAMILLGTFMATAQDEGVREQILEAKKLLKQGNIQNDQSLLLQGWGVMERIYQSHPSHLALYYFTQAEYELVRYGIGRKESDLYDRYISQAIEHAEELVEQRRDWSEALALLSSLYGMKISKSWIQGPILGPKAGALADRAVEQDSTNPRAWLVRGTMKFNTPGFFGGSVDEALRSFNRSVELFESAQQTDALQPDWGYLDALAWLGRSYEKLDQPDSALAAYRKALQIDPNFGWVKFNLLPALEKKLAKRGSK
jgi:tetratricopeptide (TPR) repeat protein